MVALKHSLIQQLGLKLDTLWTVRINPTRTADVEMNRVNQCFHQRNLSYNYNAMFLTLEYGNLAEPMLVWFSCEPLPFIILRDS